MSNSSHRGIAQAEALPPTFVPPRSIAVNTDLFRLFDRTKINGSDPPLPAVGTAHATKPLLTFFDPPIELASSGPGGRLHRDRWVDFASIRFETVLQAVVPEIHV